MARGLAAVAACPITVVKTQMEYTGPGAVQYRGTAHALSSIMRAQGLKGLFSGVGPTLLSNAPFSALYYVFYTQMQASAGGSWRCRPRLAGLCPCFPWTIHSLLAFCRGQEGTQRSGQAERAQHPAFVCMGILPA